MGIFDHRRTWQFETSASPKECLNAFVSSLNGGGIRLYRSHWKVSTSPTSDGGSEAVGRYAGRGGAIGLVGLLSTVSTNEQEAAIGSTLAFRVVPSTGGKARVTMAMTQTSQMLLFFTADARFFRSAMNRVARAMRANDPSLVLVKE